MVGAGAAAAPAAARTVGGLMAPGGTPRELPARQEALLRALLVTPCLQDAAKQAGVSERQAHRMLKDETFARYYREARAAAVAQAVGQLQAASGQAVATLCGIMQDGSAPHTARVAAARSVLETALKLAETQDLTARLEDLTARLEALESPREERLAA